MGLEVIEGWAPPIRTADASCDVVYADQVLEHMSGIDSAREFVAEALRVLRPGGVLFVVVPDYLKERGFFWDVDYTHNFVTTERRVRQLLYDGGFQVERVVRSIGAATGSSATSWRPAPSSRTFRASTRCRATRAPKICFFASARTCSKPWSSSHASPSRTFLSRNRSRRSRRTFARMILRDCRNVESFATNRRGH